MGIYFPVVLIISCAIIPPKNAQTGVIFAAAHLATFNTTFSSNCEYSYNKGISSLLQYHTFF